MLATIPRARPPRLGCFHQHLHFLGLRPRRRSLRMDVAVTERDLSSRSDRTALPRPQMGVKSKARSLRCVSLTACTSRAALSLPSTIWATAE